MTTYLISVPIHQSRLGEISDALNDDITSNYCIPTDIIIDHDCTFMSSLLNKLFKKFDRKIKPVAPHNHQSLQAEDGIKSLPTIMTKYSTGLRHVWPKYLPSATLAYNTINSLQCRKLWFI